MFENNKANRPNTGTKIQVVCECFIFFDLLSLIFLSYAFLKEVHLKINSKETKKLFTRRSFSYFLSLFFVNAAFVNFDFAYAKSSRVKKPPFDSIAFMNALAISPL